MDRLDLFFVLTLQKCNIPCHDYLNADAVLVSCDMLAFFSVHLNRMQVGTQREILNQSEWQRCSVGMKYLSRCQTANIVF